MLNTKKIAIALAVLACTSGSVFAQSVDVKVTGTITPAACTADLTGGGTIDYGVIRATELKQDALNPLAQKNININIKCASATRVALRPIDQRAPSVVGIDTSKIDKSLGDGVAGLGLSKSKSKSSIGVYTMALTDITANNTDVNAVSNTGGLKPIYSKDTGDYTGWSWGKSVTSFYKTTENVPQYISVGDSKSSDTWSPNAFTSLSAKINVQAHINKASDLDLSSEISLDGLTTIELVYL